MTDETTKTTETPAKDFLPLYVGQVVKLRDGSKGVVVEILPSDEHAYPVLVWVTKTGINTYMQSGVYCGSELPGHLDIIGNWTEPLHGEVWFNVYEGDVFGGLYGTLRKADTGALYGGIKRLARVKVQWAEGQFDE